MSVIINEICLENGIIQPVITQLSETKHVQWDVLRLDLIHPIISGNKFFKLRLYVEEALRSKQKGILTLGGAYSNHILATAYAGKKAGLSTVGIIRGEEPVHWSQTLIDARDYGMQLIFTEREKYSEIKGQAQNPFLADFPGFIFVPEGGFSQMGMMGAAGIHDRIPGDQYDWIICACGTGTMMAGLVQGASGEQQVLGIPVLKNYQGMESDIRSLLGPEKQERAFVINHDYHFGRYAKLNHVLTGFMNDFFHETSIPTDFVYTGKLMFAIRDLLLKDFFIPGSRILAIHSGGLQGNRSLKKGILDF